MPDTFIIKRDGIEIARVTAEHLAFSKRVKPGSMMNTEIVDDPKMFSMKTPTASVLGKTVFVVMVSMDPALTVEKVP